MSEDHYEVSYVKLGALILGGVALAPALGNALVRSAILSPDAAPIVDGGLLGGWCVFVGSVVPAQVRAGRLSWFRRQRSATG